MAKYQRLIKFEQDLYDENGTYQLSFFQTGNQLTHLHKLTPKEQKEEIQKEKITLRMKEYQKLLNQENISYEKINQIIQFSQTMLHPSFQNFLLKLTPSTKIDLIKLQIHLLIHLYNTLDQKSFMELATLFFDKDTEKSLNYDSDIESSELDQGIIGLLRSEFLYLNHLETAQKLKRKKD